MSDARIPPSPAKLSATPAIFLLAAWPAFSSAAPTDPGQDATAVAETASHDRVGTGSETVPGEPETAPGLTELDASPRRAGLHLSRLAALLGGGAAVHYVGFEYFDRAWYQGQKTSSIRWIHDWSGDTYLNLDKGGHFMGGVFLSRGLSGVYRWTGFGDRSAALLGTLTSWGALLEIEMRDAYFREWGFSVPDFAANTLGAAVPLLHALVPASRAVGFKISYWPSKLYTERGQRSRDPVRPHTDYLIDDYEGMTFWMTLAVDDLLWGGAKEAWPDYLGLALGYGATGLHGSNVKSKGRFKEYKDLPDARPEIFVALDYDARYLPGHGELWSSFKTQLNWIHFPAPAVRIYPDFRFYLLFM